MARLAAHVHVQDESGVWRAFGPDDKVPTWAEKQVTNPEAWVDDDDSGGYASTDGPPPKGGRGSGVEAWAEYASAHNVEVTGDMTRDDIIAALDAADVPTE